MVTPIITRVREGVTKFVVHNNRNEMKQTYQRPEVCEETNLPCLAFLEAASGRIQDYEEIPDTWN